MPTTDLETVIAIPPVPFREGRIDFSAHEKNVNFLVERNFLSGRRKRAIAIGGTSLIHHLDFESMARVTDVTGQVIQQRAVMIAGIVPSPLSAARAWIDRTMKNARAPDYFLLMPIAGIHNPEGLRRDLGTLIDSCAEHSGARFLLYMRQRSLVPVFSQMLNQHRGLEGVKVGTVAQDVANLIAAVPREKKVLWGVGDRATEAAELGSPGHTSGITLICPRACDGIHNAYYSGEFQEAYRLERIVGELENIRFENERAHNYSAVVSAAKVAGFRDVDLGDGGPFNAEPSRDILTAIERCMKVLAEYH